MNRKDRRRNRKLERREVQGPSPAQPLFADAARKLDAGDVAAAEALLDKAIAADPRHAEAHHLMGLLDYRAGRFVDAAERMLEAATLDENNPVFNANCAAVLNLIGRAPEAEAASRHAIELKPDYAEAYNSLAVALDVQNRRTEAIAAAAKAAAQSVDPMNDLHGSADYRRHLAEVLTRHFGGDFSLEAQIDALQFELDPLSVEIDSVLVLFAGG